MNLLATIVAVILLDRTMPVAVWTFGFTSYKTELKAIFRAYKVFSFPRTLFGGIVCVPDVLAFLVSFDRDALDEVVLGLFLIFGATAAFDAMRAIRLGGYRDGIMSRH